MKSFPSCALFFRGSQTDLWAENIVFFKRIDSVVKKCEATFHAEYKLPVDFPVSNYDSMLVFGGEMISPTEVSKAYPEFSTGDKNLFAVNLRSVDTKVKVLNDNLVFVCGFDVLSGLVDSKVVKIAEKVGDEPRYQVQGFNCEATSAGFTVVPSKEQGK